MNDKARSTLDNWLLDMVRQEASDLFLISGVPRCFRIHGEIETAQDKALSPDDIESAILPVLPSHVAEHYRNLQVADSSYRIPGAGRFRINLHHERGKVAATIRALPTAIPELSELNLPAQIENLLKLPRGLVLIGGPAGSGKTTTVAALVNEINRRERKHIITIEDPIEYEHSNQNSIFEQVEIGIDAPDYPTALKAALRQSPDVLVVGEMRDPETMRLAVTAAETGHLVFSTIHTTDIASTISRIADSFPGERQNTIRQELAMSLAAVFTQILMQSSNGTRVPAAELLMIGYGARRHIRVNALHQLHQEITLTKTKGSFSLEDSLSILVREKLIDEREAQQYANHPDELTSLMRNPFTR